MDACVALSGDNRITLRRFRAENAEAISFDLLTPRLTRPGPDQLTQ
jgi:hypothetical protein